METLFYKLGYKENEKLSFLNKGRCGMWLIWIGVIIIFGTITGGSNCLNPFVFGVGYSFGMFMMLRSKFVEKHFSLGENSKFQNRISCISILFMFIIMLLISGRYFATYNYRMIWLGALLATAIHFIPFSLVHGKLLLILSIPLAINSLVGMFEPSVSFYYFGIIDGIIKVIFGIILIKTRKIISE
ncbi:DUF6609 family protein [Clostridium hydrogenum]|uniref:DUF6609 family protein n=1 Tax=Clostridium hydrogenum TaxID=2855764 RepID=UPI001F3F7B55|nr:DUF6609 family protein [Clostridium hydrogenum]